MLTRLPPFVSRSSRSSYSGVLSGFSASFLAVATSSEEMETLIREVIDPLPGVVSCSCNIILSRIKDIKGLRL